MSRTKRRPYTKSKAVDGSCRGRGGCPWCLGNRLHAARKQQARADASNEASQANQVKAPG